MRRFLTWNSLSIAFLAIFLATVFAQAIAGNAKYNNDAKAHHDSTISLGRYVTSSEFGQAVMENWQSEFLQFSLYIFGTVWLIQKGSPESKKPGEQGVQSDQDQYVGQYALAGSPSWAGAGGVRGWLYANSLLIVMGAIFLLSWLGQSVAGTVVASQEQVDHGLPPLTWVEYIGSADFWDRTLQNWQSEFLAVGCMVAFSIYLRQRGSSESKPVGAPHEATAVGSE